MKRLIVKLLEGIAVSLLFLGTLVGKTGIAMCKGSNHIRRAQLRILGA